MKNITMMLLVAGSLVGDRAYVAPTGLWPRLVRGRLGMKRWKSHLFVIGCLLACITSNAWASEPVLSIGVPVNGIINSSAQVNRYTLDANKGDILDFTLLSTSSTSGTFSAAFQLVNSAGAVEASVYAGTCGTNCGYCGGNIVPMYSFTIPATGTYQVLVYDCNHTDEGDYTLYVQRLNGPPGSINLPYSEAVTGKIAAKPEMNSYTFSANEGDVLDFTLLSTSSTSGTFSAATELVNLAGTVIDSAYAGTCGTNCGYCGGNTVPMNLVTIPKSGTYTLFVWDCSLWYTGNYSIWMQKMNSPGGAFPIVFDEVQTGTISSLGQKNAYSFSVDSGDTVSDLTITPTNTRFSPAIQLFTAKGKLLQSAYAGTCGLNCGYCSGGSTLDVSALQTSGAGEYYLFVTDCTGWNTGSFQFSTQCSGVCPLPVPVLISISPSSAKAGSPALTLTVNGMGFAHVESQSVVEWDTSHLQTTFINTTQLTAIVPKPDLLAPGTHTVCVYTPPPGGGYSEPCRLFTVEPNGPVITKLTPPSAIAGGPGFTLTVTGSGFITGSVVYWGTQPLTTTYVNSTELKAAVTAADIAKAGIPPITVRNSPTIISPPVNFYVYNPVPEISSLNPSMIIAGGSGFTLKVIGSGFVHGSLVEWNGHGLTTNYVSPTEVEASVPASDTWDETVSITVYNTGPGGGTSNSKPLTIDNPVPVLMSLSPASVTHGSGGFMLTVNGFDFNEGAQVLWNGKALPTVFNSDMQLIATVPSSDTAAAGTVKITVMNPAPTPSASNPLTFTIK